MNVVTELNGSQYKVLMWKKLWERKKEREIENCCCKPKLKIYGHEKMNLF